MDDAHARRSWLCFHEPFGEAWYQGDDAQWPRLQPDSPRQPGLSTASVLATLKEAAAKKPVFSKDFAQYTDHIWSDKFYDLFQHSFLIRDPAKVFTSVYKNWDHFVKKEIGFDEQRALFDIMTERLGAPPPVIDSDDLMEDPHRMVEAYCKAVGIPFIPEALSWEPGAREEVLWYDKEKVWHANLINSDGLKPQPRKTVDITEAPDWVQVMYQEALPHYKRLYQHRITVSA